MGKLMVQTLMGPSAECTCVLMILQFNNADGDDGDGDIPRPQCRVITLIAMPFVLA